MPVSGADMNYENICKHALLRYHEFWQHAAASKSLFKRPKDNDYGKTIISSPGAMQHLPVCKHTTQDCLCCRTLTLGMAVILPSQLILSSASSMHLLCSPPGSS